ncbi:transglycosylase domain-containing protein, partial [Leptolyngbya cf. ectocarpi LEGE 11479]
MANWIAKVKSGGTKGKSSAAAVAKQRQPRPLYQSFVFWLALLAGAGLAGPATRGYRFWQEANANLPDVSDALTFERTGTITIKSDDGDVLQKIGPATQEYLEYDDIPDTLIEAFIAAEDRRFYEHAGIDYKGIARAIYSNLRNRELVEGASTITQQVAKNMLLTNDQTVIRKLKEAIVARRMESAFSKEHIIELYLNEIYLGGRSYGVGSAALNYFNKSLPELDLSEAAVLASLPKFPGRVNPYTNPER